MMKVAIIGVGNMGSKYARLIQDKKIEGFSLAALTRVREAYQDGLKESIENGVPVFESADALFEAYEKGELELDAVVIATPHYAHETQAVRAFQNGLHVLTDKPLGVYTSQADRMIEAADQSGKVFAAVFNQRTNPIYKRVRELVQSGKYGNLKRVNWVVTDWYRPDQYYVGHKWHATWKNDGGGVLLNQCPHNLDLLQWICGMPVRVQGFCQFGRFHDIEVEDDVTAYMEWENGANGTFITSTGDAPGVNRLEISMDEALLVCENGELRIAELEPEIGMKEAEYRKTSTEFFKKLNGVWTIEKPEAEPDAYQKVLQNFADVILQKEDSLIADGREGINSLYLSNAIYLSSWEHSMQEIPEQKNVDAKKVFSQNFEAHLEQLKNRNV